MNENMLFNFIGNKWFILVLALAMCLVLPTTYNNLIIVYEAGEMSKLWWVPVIFIVNLITVILAFYKFISSLAKKKEEVKNW